MGPDLLLVFAPIPHFQSSTLGGISDGLDTADIALFEVFFFCSLHLAFFLAELISFVGLQHQLPTAFYRQNMTHCNLFELLSANPSLLGQCLGY